jgi:hypothetical protein
MQGTLLLAILTIRSSYADNIELLTESDADIPDTLQWWIDAAGAWRIRTYAIDHDIHTHRLDGNHDFLALARENNRKHYGDVVKIEYLVKFVNCLDEAEVKTEFHRVGLAMRLEIAAGQFAFWKADDAKYSTRTESRSTL